jgi:hypothetical protein
MEDLLMFNEFDNHDDALLAVILDTMQFMKDYDDDGSWTNSMFKDVRIFSALKSFYQQFLDGDKSRDEVIQEYSNYKDQIKGRWDSIKTGTNGKFYYLVYSGSLNSYTTNSNPPLPIEEEIL